MFEELKHVDAFTTGTFLGSASVTSAHWDGVRNFAKEGGGYRAYAVN